uniref:Uncharacterized protein n=1 Tax=Triticum urartu TaxID=4572 RepID=A0A8R7PX25_TRIUA
MVNPSGVLLGAAQHIPRITSMTRLVHRLVLVLLCTMVAENIMAALRPSKLRNTVITRWIRRILSQILMAIGGKARFTTKQELGVLSLYEQGNRRGRGVEPNFLDSSYIPYIVEKTFAHQWWQYLDASSLLGRCCVCVCVPLPSYSIACALAVKCNEPTST